MLTAPLAGTTHGRDDGYAAFRRAYVVFPDLSASIGDWACSDTELIIPMRFRATIGRRRVEWNNIDRFIFRDGNAVERKAYFNPFPIVAAILKSPSTLYRYVKTRLGRAPASWPVTPTMRGLE